MGMGAGAPRCCRIKVRASNGLAAAPCRAAWEVHRATGGRFETCLPSASPPDWAAPVPGWIQGGLCGAIFRAAEIMPLQVPSCMRCLVFSRRQSGEHRWLVLIPTGRAQLCNIGAAPHCMAEAMLASDCQVGRTGQLSAMVPVGTISNQCRQGFTVRLNMGSACLACVPVACFDTLRVCQLRGQPPRRVLRARLSQMHMCSLRCMTTKMPVTPRRNVAAFDVSLSSCIVSQRSLHGTPTATASLVGMAARVHLQGQRTTPSMFQRGERLLFA